MAVIDSNSHTLDRAVESNLKSVCTFSASNYTFEEWVSAVEVLSWNPQIKGLLVSFNVAIDKKKKRTILWDELFMVIKHNIRIIQWV